MQTLILEKIRQGFYKLSEHSDEFMYVLHLFLNYGPFPASYIDFLKNSEKKDFSGNVVNLYKKNSNVTIEISEDLIPDMPLVTVSQQTLLKLLQEFELCKAAGADKIEITFLEKSDEIYIKCL